MILRVDQHQADLHLPFALIAFNQLCLHQVRFVQRRAGLFHHGFRGGEISLLGLLQCGIGQAAGLSGVDDKPHHHFFEIVLDGFVCDNIIQI